MGHWYLNYHGVLYEPYCVYLNFYPVNSGYLAALEFTVHRKWKSMTAISHVLSSLIIDLIPLGVKFCQSYPHQQH